MTFDHKEKSGGSREAAEGTYQPVQPVRLRPPSPAALAPDAPMLAAPTAPSRVPFTLDNSRSAPPAPQRARAAPVLTAAGLLSADRATLQRAASEVQASQAELDASGAALTERGLRPESEATLERFAPGSPPAAPVLTAFQRQLATETGQQQVAGAFLRDARVLPAAMRAELALGALQRAVEQGADGAALHARLAELAQTPQDQEAVGRAVGLQRQKEAREAQAREGYALQRAHLGLQRRLDGALQRQTEANLGTVTQRVQARRGSGEPLPAAVQRHLEQGLNADLSRVRVHADGEAAKLAAGVQAEAFTTGQDIYFGANRYDPGSATGLNLLAHEATHTVQQARGQVAPGLDPDAGLEAEARQMGEALAQGVEVPQALSPAPRTAKGGPGGTVQRRASQNTASNKPGAPKPRPSSGAGTSPGGRTQGNAAKPKPVSTRPANTGPATKPAANTSKPGRPAPSLGQKVNAVLNYDVGSWVVEKMDTAGARWAAARGNQELAQFFQNDLQAHAYMKQVGLAGVTREAARAIPGQLQNGKGKYSPGSVATGLGNLVGVGDVKGLLTGTDLKGNKVNRYQAGLNIGLGLATGAAGRGGTAAGSRAAGNAAGQAARRTVPSSAVVEMPGVGRVRVAVPANRTAGQSRITPQSPRTTAAGPRGARTVGTVSGRSFDSDKIGIPIAKLDTSRIKVTEKGISVVVKHLSRFEGDVANKVMIGRLRKIAAGKIKPTPRILTSTLTNYASTLAIENWVALPGPA